MGVLPLQFINNQNRKNLKITGNEIINIFGIDNLKPNIELNCLITTKQEKKIKLLCRIDTVKELDYYKQGGILQYVINSIIKKAS